MTKADETPAKRPARYSRNCKLQATPGRNVAPDRSSCKRNKQFTGCKVGKMNNVEAAFHEAGHVVMAMLWGVWRVNRVSIAGVGNSGDRIEYASATETEGKELWQHFGIRLFDAKVERIMGGPVARAILVGSDVVYEGSTGHSDFDTIVSAIQDGMPGSSPAEAWAVIHEHEPVVQADLKRVWPIVEALARELMQQQELCDHEIRSIVRTAVNALPENERNWAISRLRSTSPRS